MAWRVWTFWGDQMSHGHRYRYITIKGIVCPTEWNAGGEVERVSIMTWDEDEYDVLQEDAGRDLIEYTNRAVTARGQILPEFRKRKVIRIKSFSVSTSRGIETPCLDSL
jgi:hypothetical protein